MALFLSLAIIFYRNKVELEIFVALIGKGSNVPVLTVFANILCAFYFPQNLISVRNTTNKNL